MVFTATKIYSTVMSLSRNHDPFKLFSRSVESIEFLKYTEMYSFATKCCFVGEECGNWTGLPAVHHIFSPTTMLL